VNEEYTLLRDALDKLQLNDAALTYEAESSAALGFGYRCGFLGLLHMERSCRSAWSGNSTSILITTAPSVVYRVVLKDGTVKEIDNPTALPPMTHVEHIEEPFVRATVLVPDEFIGAVMEVCQERRGTFITMEYITPERARLEYDLPLAEILMDFFDRLKSRTKGYASLDYEFIGLPTVRCGQTGHPAQRESRGCPVHPSFTGIRPWPGAGRWRRSSKRLSPASSLRCPFKRPSRSKIIARETVRAPT